MELTGNLLWKGHAAGLGRCQPQRVGDRFKNRLTSWCAFAPYSQADMQRNTGIHCECAQEFFRQAQIIFACALLGKFRPKRQKWPSTYIHRSKRKRFSIGM